MAKIQDKYVNKAFVTVTESSINTLTFAELQTGMAMFEKVAWIIHRIEWFPGNVALRELVANTDILTAALVGNNKMTALTLGDPAVYDIFSLVAAVSGTPATQFIHSLPIIRDFSSLPGTGLIIPPRPLFVAVKGTGAAAAMIVQVRIMFTYKQLQADEYWELVEATRLIE